MRVFRFLPSFRIGTKLGICIGIGVALIAGLIVNEQITSNSIEKLTATADRQQATVIESINTELVLQRVQLAGRDLRMARTATKVQALLGELQTIAAEAKTRLSTLEAQTNEPANRERFQRLQVLFRDQVAALGEIGSKQTEIFALFAKLDQIESKWARNINIVVNSAPFANLPNYRDIEAFINEAASQFKDGRTASWRYFLLNEASQTRRISASTDQAIQQLNYANRAVADKDVVGGVDTLQKIVAEYTSILQETTKAIDAQNATQTERANPAEAGSRALLAQAIETANASSDAATAQAAVGVTRAGRIRIGIGLVVGLVLIGAAAFASLAIGKPVRKSARC